MDLACERLHAVGRPDGLIACTDADSEAAPDWLAAQLAAVAAGARAIGGRAALSDAEQEALGPEIRARREREAAARLERAREQAAPGARTEHWQFSGASMALTAERLPAGRAARAAHRRSRTRGWSGCCAATASRSTGCSPCGSPPPGGSGGRAPRGLAVDLRRARWLADRRYDGAAYRAAELAERKAATVSLVLPAREVAGTIGGVLDALAPLERAGLVDEVLVVDAASRDGTARIAAGRGARVADESALLRDFGPALGKGDAMWRGLAATSGDIVAFLDTDTEDFHAGFALGLLGPLIEDPGLAFVKGAFRRPLRVGDTRGARRRRPRHRARGAPAAQPPPARPGRLPAAARGRGRRPAGAARAARRSRSATASRSRC